jgi:hypothetical protein
MKKKTKKIIHGTIIPVALTAAAVLVMAACSPVAGPEISGPPAGKGVVNIQLGDGSAPSDSAAVRTLLPGSVTDTAFDAYDLAFTVAVDNGSGTAQTFTGVSSLTAALDAGKYDLALTAKKGTAPVAAGEYKNITVTDGGSTPVTVSLVFNPGAGNGTLSFTITRPSGLDLSGAEFVLSPLFAGGTPDTTDWLYILYNGEKKETYSATETIASGYYRAAVTLSTPERKAVKSDIVHIGAGQTTTLNWTFTADEFATIFDYIRLVGIPSWGTTAPDTVGTTENPDGTYTWRVNAATDATFRFILDDTSTYEDKWWARWFHSETNETVVSAAGSYDIQFSEGKPNLAWKLSNAGWYSLTVNPYAKTLVVQPHTTPVISNAAITNGDKGKLTLTFSEAVTISGEAPYGFTLTGTSALSITGKTGSGTSYTFTLNREAVQDEMITLAYTGNAVTSVAAQIPLAPATNQTVTNTVKAYPAITSATIENSQKNKLVLVFSKTVTIPYSYLTGFTVTGSPDDITITNVSGNNYTWTFDLNRNVTAGENITLTYNGNTVGDTVDGNPLKPITDMVVTNNVGLDQLPAPAQPSLSDAGIASWSGLSDETNVAKYTVQLYKGSSTQGNATEVNKGTTCSHDFRTVIISEGAGVYTVTVKAIATASAADSPASTASAAFTVTPLTLVRLTWIGGTDTATLPANDTIESGGSFDIPVGKSLVIGTGIKIAAGKLELGEGAWKAVGTNNSKATISSAAITLDQGVQLGSNGSSNSHLGGNGLGTASYTASISTGVVVLKQNTSGLEITTPNTGAKMVMGANALIHIKADETLTIGADTVLETGNYLDIGPGTWKASVTGVNIEGNKIQLGNNGYASFGIPDNRTVLGVNNTTYAQATNTYTASGAKVTLGQDGTNLTISGASTAAILTMGATTDIYVSGGLMVDTAQLSAPTGTSGGQIRVLAGQTLSIANNGKVTADLLELSTGTWKATTTTVTIKASQIAMDSAAAWGGKFGKDDGIAATVLAAPFENGKDVSDTGWSAGGAKVTLSQDGNNLTVKGADVAAHFYVWKTGGIWVKAGLIIDTVTVNMDSHLPDDNGWTSSIYMKPGSTITFPNTNSRIKVYPPGSYGATFDNTWWGKSSQVTLGSNIRMQRRGNNDGEHQVTDIYVNADGTGNENKLINIHGTNDFWIARGFDHD